MQLVLFLICFAAAAFAQQPFLFYGGAYHAATYSPAGLPNGPLPRGGLISVFGRNLGPATAATANAFPLNPTLAGVRLQLVRGTQTFDTFPVFVSAGQINAILPSNAPLGKSVLRLQFNNLTSNIIPVDVVQSNFGIFSINSAGYGPAIVTNFDSAESQPINSLEQAAKPGQVITIWGSGLGPVAFGDNVAPTPGDVTSDLTVYIGGLPASRLYAGRAPCCAGLDQIVVTIPPNVPQGCWVPIQVRAGGITSNTATIAVAGERNACSDEFSPFSTVIRRGGKMARLLTSRSISRVDVAMTRPVTFTFDSSIAQFAEYTPNPFAWQIFDSLPPPGACVTYATKGMAIDISTAIAGLNGLPLDPGSPLSIQSTIAGSFSKVLNLANLFYANLQTATQLFFSPGQEVTISTSGSTSVPALSVRTTPNLTTPWMNRDAAVRFSTTQPIPVSWTPLPGGLILAVGFSYRTERNASAFFACTARSEAGSLSVPAYIVSALPKESAFFDSATSTLALVYVPNPGGTPVSLPGFNAASAVHLNVQERTVRFR